MTRNPDHGRFSDPRQVVRVLAVLLGLRAGELGAADARAQFLVQATVLPAARLIRLQEPQEFAVTRDDAARGYVDVLAPTRLTVQSNTPGFVLDVHSRLPVLAGIGVYGLQGQVTLRGEGGSIVERAHPAGASDVDLTFRLVLAPGTPPGRYAWPLSLAVRPYGSD